MMTLHQEARRWALSQNWSRDKSEDFASWYAGKFGELPEGDRPEVAVALETWIAEGGAGEFEES